ncbi:MAG: membrane protein insertase YidC [Deltaproteobacteria bacterium]|nr:membrane protein insertase YidC [Deltaproteobacteria bacterium]
MSQNLRMIVFVVLSASIFFIYSTFFAPPVTQQAALPDQQSEAVQASAQEVAKKDAVLKAPLVASDLKETKAEETIIAIKTNKAQIKLSTKGGVFTEYVLNDYRESADLKSPQQDLLKDEANRALFLGLKGVPAFTEDKIFQVVSDNSFEGKREIRLQWQNSQVVFEKIITVGDLPSDYGVTVDYRVQNLSDAPLALSPYLQHRVQQKEQKQKGGFLSRLKMQQPDVFIKSYFKDEALESEQSWEEELAAHSITGQVRWGALADRYFAFISVDEAANNTLSYEKQGQILTSQFYREEALVQPQQTVAGRFVAFIGPKELKELSAMNHSLQSIVDYGWFSILAEPILWLMTFLHGFIPNWGLVIIVLTFIVKILLHPVNKKSMTSMKGMQLLQPKLQQIKERYPDDREKQNQEIMQLFRTHKVNPMGGCLPMVLQMPIYIVLYKVLWNAIELYHAPFVGIYNDLSAPDPYFILPVFLGVFMVLQQKLTPAATTDPTQKKMMMIMPVMFTGFMLFLPVGLVLYIFVNTLMTVIQQFMLKRDLSVKDFVTGKWQAKEAS